MERVISIPPTELDSLLFRVLLTIRNDYFLPVSKTKFKEVGDTYCADISFSRILSKDIEDLVRARILTAFMPFLDDKACYVTYQGQGMRITVVNRLGKELVIKDLMCVLYDHGTVAYN